MKISIKNPLKGSFSLVNYQVKFSCFHIQNLLVLIKFVDNTKSEGADNVPKDPHVSMNTEETWLSSLYRQQLPGVQTRGD